MDPEPLLSRAFGPPEPPRVRLGPPLFGHDFAVSSDAHRPHPVAHVVHFEPDPDAVRDLFERVAAAVRAIVDALLEAGRALARAFGCTLPELAAALASGGELERRQRRLEAHRHRTAGRPRSRRRPGRR